MHKQDFEKSVQQKMEELSFTPSAPVWERVSAEIRPQKRRRIAFWALPLALLVGTGGWWLLQENGSAGEVAVNKNAATVQPPAGDRTTNLKSESKNADQDLKVSGDVPTDVTSAPPAQQNNTSKKFQPVGQASAQPKSTGTFATRSTGKNISWRSGITAKINKRNSIFEETFSTSTNANSVDNVDKVFKEQNAETVGKRTIPIVPLFPAERIQPGRSINGKEQNATSLPAKPKAAVAKHQDWQWGGHVHYGIANVKNGNLLGGASAADFFNGSPFPAQNNGNAGFAGLYPQMERGSYFATGLTIQRSMGRRVAIGAGLQFESYSQRQAIGEAVSRSAIPSNVNADALEGNVFYRDNSKRSFFHNKFRQLTLPVFVQVKPIRRIPLELTAGINTGYIVSAKKLSYDTATRLYYATTPELNNLQVSGVGAIQYKFLERGGWQLLAGPQVQYHFSQLNKNGGTPQRLYTYNFGVQLRRK